MESTTQYRATQCPSRDVLLAYCSGKLPDVELEAVDTHLATCESCLAFLDSQHPSGLGSNSVAKPVVLFTDEESAKSSLLDDTAFEKHRGDSELQRLKARAKAIKIDFDREPADLDSPSLVPTRPAAKNLPEKIDRYFVIKKLGNGAFANVYLARDPEQDRLVAIKVPRRDRLKSPAQIEEFLQQARTAATLDHPHIVREFDFGRLSDGSCFVVMKYIEGTTLEAAMNAERFSFERIAEVCIQIAEALDHAHQKGIFHRDVKPANILLDKQGRAYVADFGLAIQEETQYLHKDERAGTWPYMSPEQIRGKSHHLDARSDVWSLGVIFYELLTREKPFPSKIKADLEEEIQFREPKPPKSIERQIPQELERICLRCLTKSIVERTPSAMELAEELRQWGAALRRGKRNLIAIAVTGGTGLVTCLVLAGSAVAIWGIPFVGAPSDNTKSLGAPGATSTTVEQERPRGEPFVGDRTASPPGDVGASLESLFDVEPKLIFGHPGADAEPRFDVLKKTYSVNAKNRRWIASVRRTDLPRIRLHTVLRVQNWLGKGGVTWGFKDDTDHYHWLTVEFSRVEITGPARVVVRDLVLLGASAIAKDNCIASQIVELPASPETALEVEIESSLLKVNFDKKRICELKAPNQDVPCWMPRGTITLGLTGDSHETSFKDLRLSTVPTKEFAP